MSQVFPVDYLCSAPHPHTNAAVDPDTTALVHFFLLHVAGHDSSSLDSNEDHHRIVALCDGIRSNEGSAKGRPTTAARDEATLRAVQAQLIRVSFVASISSMELRSEDAAALAERGADPVWSHRLRCLTPAALAALLPMYLCCRNTPFVFALEATRDSLSTPSGAWSQSPSDSRTATVSSDANGRGRSAAVPGAGTPQVRPAGVTSASRVGFSPPRPSAAQVAADTLALRRHATAEAAKLMAEHSQLRAATATASATAAAKTATQTAKAEHTTIRCLLALGGLQPQFALVSPETEALAARRDVLLQRVQALRDSNRMAARISTGSALDSRSAAFSGIPPTLPDDGVRTPSSTSPAFALHRDATAAISVPRGPFEGDRASLVSRAALWATARAESGALRDVSADADLRVQTLLMWAAVAAYPQLNSIRLEWARIESPTLEACKAHLACIAHRRDVLLVADASAGAAAFDQIQGSSTRSFVEGWLRVRIANAVGYVGDLVGAAMLYAPDWSAEQRPPFGQVMRRVHFGMRPDMTMLDSLNHPIVPFPVRRARKEWEHCVQVNPVLWRFKSQGARLAQAVGKVSKYLLCNPSSVRLFTHKDQAFANVLHSLPWLATDRILVMEHAPYESVLRLLTHIADRSGVEVVLMPPTVAVEAISEALRQVRPRVLIVPHITELADIMPLARLIDICTLEGLILIVDGSEAVGNISRVNISEIGADFYIARLDVYCFCNPGVTLLVTHPRRQKALTTLTVSYFQGRGYTEEWTYTGLADISLWLSCIQAFQFRKYVCPGHTAYIRDLAREGHSYLLSRWNVPALMDPASLCHGVIVVLLPHSQGRGRVDALHTGAILSSRRVHVQLLTVPLNPRSMRTSATSEPGTGSKKARRFGGAGGGSVEHLVARITCQVFNDMNDFAVLADAVLVVAAEWGGPSSHGEPPAQPTAAAASGARRSGASVPVPRIDPPRSRQ